MREGCFQGSAGKGGKEKAKDAEKACWADWRWRAWTALAALPGLWTLPEMPPLALEPRCGIMIFRCRRGSDAARGVRARRPAELSMITFVCPGCRHTQKLRD